MTPVHRIKGAAIERNVMYRIFHAVGKIAARTVMARAGMLD